MAIKSIYFYYEGNKNSIETIVQIATKLEILNAKCLFHSSSSGLIKRLRSRKTKVDFLVLMMRNMGNGFIAELCKDVPVQSYPRCVVFVRSLVSSISDEEFRQHSTALDLSGIESFTIGLIELSNLSLISQILKI